MRRNMSETEIRRNRTKFLRFLKISAKLTSLIVNSLESDTHAPGVLGNPLLLCFGTAMNAHSTLNTQGEGSKMQHYPRFHCDPEERCGRRALAISVDQSLVNPDPPK